MTRLKKLLQGAAVVGWHALSFFLVVATPVLIRLGDAIWGLEPERLAQMGLRGAAYLGVVALLAGGRSKLGKPHPQPLRTVAFAAFGSVAFFGIAALAPRVWPSLPSSGSILALACTLSFVLASLPLLLSQRALLVGLPVLLSGAVWVASGGPGLGWRWEGSDPGTHLSSRTVETLLYRIEVTEYSDETLRAAAAQASGGGLHAAGPFLVLGTGAGTFHLISEDSTGVSVQDLPLASPANAADFDRDAPVQAQRVWFRVQDVWAEAAGGELRIVASHHYWHADRQCFVLRVSETRLRLGASETRTGDPWRTLFETEPCLPLKSTGDVFAGLESGGRLLRTPEGVLLSVGDHEFDGVNNSRMLAQEEGHYGKTVLIPDPPGAPRVYTSGHRNPQGLFRDSDGNVWLTEHGPRGGDELNRLVEGENYGWPLVTYGTEYDSRIWPVEPVDPSHRGFRSPEFAWVPSVGISNAVATDSPLFPAWRGDLMIASLVGLTLFRTRLEDGSVRYVEPISLGRRLRDIVQAGSGRLVAWTDRGSILFLSQAPESPGEDAVRPCLWCHSMDAGVGADALAPDLNSIVGRRIAARPFFAYSDPLARLSGRWTIERLDRFLEDPQAFVPGTTMAFPGIPDPERRRALIEYLQKLN